CCAAAIYAVFCDPGHVSKNVTHCREPSTGVERAQQLVGRLPGCAAESSLAVGGTHDARSGDEMSTSWPDGRARGVFSAGAIQAGCDDLWDGPRLDALARAFCVDRGIDRTPACR